MDYIIVGVFIPAFALLDVDHPDVEYPARVAFVMLGQVLEEFTQQYGSDVWSTCSTPESLPMEKAEEYVTNYQNPSEADKVTKIQNDLDETTSILHKTIDSVCLLRASKLHF